ncbi:ABC transporter ATP-binding protein [Haladaptatus sp. DYF46]|uniref:ABC transporter ATP-binding protein n=1 Tax=Haladaptatus sp. DYF46 TaxID=2886041 RepID=UPI001E57C3F5|nr:ABC transporter ATP-binding protein [Haladaptatus sp. DYF46]
MNQPAIVATDLERSFGDERVLRGASLTVDPGELLAVLGPNGVGKSVLFSCLAGSEHPSAGTVDVFGTPASERSDTTSFLLQDALCLPRLTGRQNIRFYSQLHPAFVDNWHRYAEALGLIDDLDKPVNEYSGGMKRKLELVIALSIDVPLYILDEPTAALDLPTIQEVHALLREKQDEGKTIVFSSHQPMDADIADRLAFVADGRVVATGVADELFNAVPAVVEANLGDAELLAGHVLGGEVFRGNGTIRGFASEETALESLPEGLTVVSPTYTDLFNYYTNQVAKQPTDD